MVVKTSVSISTQQDAFARKLVEDGRFSSVSAVIQHGIELLREQTEAKDAELEAWRTLIAERRAGEFLSRQESDRQIEDLIARKKAAHGL